LLHSASLHSAIKQTSAFFDSEAIIRFFLRNRNIIRNNEAALLPIPRVGFFRYGRIKAKA